MGMLVRPFILRTKTCSLLPPFSLLLAGCQSLPLRTPPAGVLEPVEVLRLLQQRHISLQEGGGGGGAPNRVRMACSIPTWRQIKSCTRARLCVSHHITRQKASLTDTLCTGGGSCALTANHAAPCSQQLQSTPPAGQTPQCHQVTRDGVCDVCERDDGAQGREVLAGVP
jgi:hypothetical protein